MPKQRRRTGSGATKPKNRKRQRRLKPDSIQGIIDAATSKLEEFKAVDGLVSVTTFMASPTTIAVYASYLSKEQLVAATPTIGAILKGMGPFFAAPPTPLLAEIQYSSLE